MLEAVPSSRQKGIMIRLPVELLDHVDAMATRYQMSRERTIRLALAGMDEATLLRGFAKLPMLAEENFS